MDNKKNRDGFHVPVSLRPIRTRLGRSMSSEKERERPSGSPSNDVGRGFPEGKRDPVGKSVSFLGNAANQTRSPGRFGGGGSGVADGRRGFAAFPPSMTIAAPVTSGHDGGFDPSQLPPRPSAHDGSTSSNGGGGSGASTPTKQAAVNAESPMPLRLVRGMSDVTLQARPLSPSRQSGSPLATVRSSPDLVGMGVGLQKSNSSSKRSGGRSSGAFWLAIILVLVVLWGLRERDRVYHLESQLGDLRTKLRNATIRLHASETLLHHHHQERQDQGSILGGSKICLPGDAGEQCPSPDLVSTGLDDEHSLHEPSSEIPVTKQDKGSEDDEDEAEGAGGSEPDRVLLRRTAFLVCLICLLLPAILIKYMDDLPHWFEGLQEKLVGDEGGSGSGGGGSAVVGGSNIAPEEEVPFSKRLAYKVDVWFSTYSWVKSAALLAATLVLINVGGLALYAVSGEEGLALVDATWRSWTYVADAGNHADSVGIGPRFVSVCISFGGMLIFALMVGLVTDAISEKVDSLRKGKSDVIEKNHVLILGWSDKLGSLVKQLAVANESAGGGVIVIMSDRDKEEMESEIGKMDFDLRGTSVICRSGSALVPADLKKVSVSTARSIIVLAEAENADAADAHALRVVLSLSGVKEGLKGHVVVELSDLDNEQLVKMVGGHLVETVVAHDVIGRLMIQCARQPGLAQIWETLLGFENCEFYMKHWPQLEGKTFRDVLLSFPDAIPCGVRTAGQIVLNPDDDYIIQPNDAVLVIAEDDDSYAPAPLPELPDVPLPDVVMPPKLPEKILFCGWRRDIDDMIVVLEAFLARGSELWIFSDVPTEEREERLMEGGLNPSELENVNLVHRMGNAVIRRHLESLPLETFDSILILADERHEESIINSDSRSLATLLLIRDIQSKRMPYEGSASRRAFPTAPTALPVSAARSPSTMSSWVRQMQQASAKSIVISEILDSRTRSLVQVSKISDYVLSNELVSMALAMVAEDREVNRVLEELFAEEGNEMYIRPAELYLHKDEELSFFELMLRARKRREIMIGYRCFGDEAAVINPPDKSTVRRWSLLDSFVVLSEEE